MELLQRPYAAGSAHRGQEHSDFHALVGDGQHRRFAVGTADLRELPDAGQLLDAAEKIAGKGPDGHLGKALQRSNVALGLDDRFSGIEF